MTTKTSKAEMVPWRSLIEHNWSLQILRRGTGGPSDPFVLGVLT